jgi:hypothetical protein
VMEDIANGSEMLWGERRENGIIVAATEPTGCPMPQPNDPGLAGQACMGH